MLSSEAAERDQPERHDPDDEARHERADRGRAGQRPERQPLLSGPPYRTRSTKTAPPMIAVAKA